LKPDKYTYRFNPTAGEGRGTGMNYSKASILSLLVLGFLASAGCGGSGGNSGSVNDPLATNNQGTAATTPTPTGSGAALSYALSLTTVSTSGSGTVGANSSVLTTATLKDSNGSLVDGPILFEEVIPDPATGPSVTIPSPAVIGTSSGVAVIIIKTLNPETNRDVIIKASTSINGQVVSAVSIFKVVRSAGNYISFITSKTPTDPDGNLNTLTVEVHNVDETLPKNAAYNILQLATFEVLDRNGINRTSVPVQLDIYSVLGNDLPGNGIAGIDNCSVFIDTPETTSRTVTTDNTGLGIFNSIVNVKTPPPGSENSCSVIYKATSPDPYSPGTNLYSYGGFLVTLRNTKPQ
jgi:hypothetical protein